VLFELRFDCGKAQLVIVGRVEQKLLHELFRIWRVGLARCSQARPATNKNQNQKESVDFGVVTKAYYWFWSRTKGARKEEEEIERKRKPKKTQKN
jgi:hypothetical protein